MRASTKVRRVGRRVRRGCERRRIARRVGRQRRGCERRQIARPTIGGDERTRPRAERANPVLSFAKIDDDVGPGARCASSKPNELSVGPSSMSCRGPLCSRSYSDVSS